MIHIACNIDVNFTQHCAVMLVSLFENNKTADICVHIVAPNLPEKAQDILKSLAASYDNEVHFYFPSPELLANFSIRKFGKRISMATYYRCMFSAILPATVDKVLYLDCDIVILGDISDFWNTDLTGYAVGCVEDIGYDDMERYNTLKYDPKYSYFNAGVLLINLKYWREHKVDEQCIQYFLAYPERIRYNDQDLLNALLHEHKLFVSLRWNMQDAFYRYGMEKKIEHWPTLKQDLQNPVILHYTNKKPWNYDSMHPLRKEYYTYLDMTPWKGKRPLLSLKNCFLRFVKLLPYVLKLRKPKYMKL